MTADSNLLPTPDAGSAFWEYFAVELLLQIAQFYFDKNYLAEGLSFGLWINGGRTLAILLRGLAALDKNGKGNPV